MTKGIIFDVDGTLLNSSHVWEKVDRDFISERGLVIGDDFTERLKVMKFNDSADFFVDYFHLDMTPQQVKAIFVDMVKHEYEQTIEPKAGAIEFIRLCKSMGIKMCAATAGITSLAQSALERLGIMDCLEFIITCDDVGEGKESPLVYLKAAQRMGIRPSEAVVFEDPLHCIRTAHNAGFRVVCVKDQQTADELGIIRGMGIRILHDYIGLDTGVLE